MKLFRYSLIISIVLFLVQLSFGQTMVEMAATTAAVDTLASTQAGGGLATGTYMDKARQAASTASARNAQQMASQQMGSQPTGTRPYTPPVQAPPPPPRAPTGNEYEPGRVPIGPMENKGPGGEGMMGEVPGMMATSVTPTPTPEMVKVLHGKRLKCQICSTLLEDARYEDMPKDFILSQTDQYYNDGTHGDVDPNDGIWTNIEEESNVICAKCNMIKEYYIALLVYVDNLSPREFFLLTATTTELISTIPKTIEEEKLKDEDNVRRWVREFLNIFRKDPNDPKSEFIPIYVPLPPPFPPEPLPQGFASYINRGQPGSTQYMEGMPMGGEGALMAQGVTGEPVGNASSRYFDPSRMK